MAVVLMEDLDYGELGGHDEFALLPPPLDGDTPMVHLAAAAAAAVFPSRAEVDNVSAQFLPALPDSSFWANRVADAPRTEDVPVDPAEVAPTPCTAPPCSSCNGYYGPSFSQPVCATCHAFLYANDLDAEVNLQAMTREEEMAGEGGMGGAGGEGGGEDGDGGHDDDSDRDSGNEEPADADVVEQAEQQLLAQAEQDEGNFDDGDEGAQEEDGQEQEEEDELAVGNANANAEEEEEEVVVPVVPQVVVAVNQLPPEPPSPEPEVIQHLGPVGAPVAAGQAAAAALDGDLMLPWDMQRVPRDPAGARATGGGGGAAAAAAAASIRIESLSQRLALLLFPRPSDKISEGIVANLPPEVLLHIFSFLDDLTLYAVGNVCRRWNIVLNSQVPPEQWQTFTRRRWPLFRPIARTKDWFSTFSALVESSFCLTCICQMAEVIPADYFPLPLRERRLVHDLRLLVEDPPPGIKAQPLDSSNYHWQASITGPAGSPYEGGIFFLYLKVPFTFPFDPPEVRFLTRIFHPNVSRHGDIGMDSILQHNWVSGLTIPKVLISIQSLLTDPYTAVCMEPDIGELYRGRKRLFDAVARKWTWQFAMHDAVPPRPRECLDAAAAAAAASSLVFDDDDLRPPSPTPSSRVPSRGTRATAAASSSRGRGQEEALSEGDGE